MRGLVLAGLVLLGGCAAAPSSDFGTGALAGAGTPFLVAVKVPVCILTIVAAAPVGAVSELSDPADPFGQEVRRNLGDGIAQNCGPPYAVAP